MFPFDFTTICLIQDHKVDLVVYGPDPIEERWGWAIAISGRGIIVYETGFIYESEILAQDDCLKFTLSAEDIGVKTLKRQNS